MNRNTRCAVVLAVALFSTCCSTGPAPPKPGTPAFYWSAAKTAYAAGDYQKASENLESVAKTDNEYTGRALAWNLVLLSGLVDANMQIADSFEAGAKANRANPMPFRREITKYRTYAAQMAPHFAEAFSAFLKSKDAKVTFDFAFPSGNAARPDDLGKVAKGEMPAPQAMADVEHAMVSSSVVKAACRAAGAPDDTAKAQAVFQAQPAEVARETFLFAMANSAFEQSLLYSRKQLDQPARMELLVNQAQGVLKQLPESAETKALAAKIEKAVKEDKATR